ncbi:SDR family oxidoreductase [Gordonia sp. VNQ95]|jgi:short-subunit dehydrogenase|uniref:SDR family NAD(P)-dependent oxidoreductase n=1 Tax=Gordonia TaxID=2053 RepID=UPI0032B484D5
MVNSATELFSGKSVLITGASSGIGRAFAYRAGAAGASLVLVARRTETLHRIADELRREYGAAVVVLPSDLATPGAAVRLWEALRDQDIRIDVLVNNAGIGIHGDLGAGSVAAVTTQTQLNITTLAELTALALPDMLARDAGTVINVASTAAYQPVPHMAVYAATKAFVLSFTRAVWAETRNTGVRVLAVSPGATDTEFFDTAGDDASLGNRRHPDDVVDSALAGWARGTHSVVDGCSNAWLANLAPRLPIRVALTAAERSVRPSATT